MLPAHVNNAMLSHNFVATAPTDLEQLIREALDKSVPLLEEWKKKSIFDPRGGHEKVGWHELVTSSHAGAHASCAALRLIAHPLFPLSDSERQNLAEQVVLHHLIPLFQGNKPQSVEARCSTVKVASFISACSVVGRLQILDSTFQQMLPIAKSLATELLAKRHNLCWGHWLGHDQGTAYRPTAAVIDALSRLAKVDTSIELAAKDVLACSVEKITGEFLTQARGLIRQPTNPNNQQLIVPDLWHRIPLLRTIATLPAPPNRRIPDDYEEILNAYLARSVFAWGLTDTEDFQTYDPQTGEARTTDYVSFNTTAYLVRAVIGMVRTGKLDRIHVDWVMPHLAYWARIISNNELPTPRRFSIFHQALNGLLEALEFHEAEKLNRKKILPDLLPMYINPPLFQPHEIPIKPRQGFFITPFEVGKGCPVPASLSGFTYTREGIESHITSACATCYVDQRPFLLIPGDHNYVSKGIMSHIWQYINESSFAIALCVGANANVYYEIGMAHTLGRPVLLLGRKGYEKEDFQFDLSGVRYEALPDFERSTITPVVKNFLHDFFA